MDAAVNLLENGSSVKMLTRSAPWSASHIADPSISLSPFTRELLNRAMNNPLFEVYEDADVREVVRTSGSSSTYRVHTTNGRTWLTDEVPILATGFQCGGGARQLSAFFEWNDEGYPVLTEEDSSTLFPGLYLVAPYVRHACQCRLNCGSSATWVDLIMQEDSLLAVSATRTRHDHTFGVSTSSVGLHAPQQLRYST